VVRTLAQGETGPPDILVARRGGWMTK
jgi:hypothetical protein